MFHFCTYFDENYLVRGLTLYRSLRAHVQSLELWVLCLDEKTLQILSKLDDPNLHPIPLQELERNDKALLIAKHNRGRIEYYFTLTPALPLYILRHFSNTDLITYLDADLFFYSNPSPIYDELGENSILITPHRFPDYLRDLEKWGVYNVGYLTFRNNSIGVECLEWWRDRCLEYCGMELRDGKYADQKYLDDWTSRFNRVTVLQHKGAGLAPWNWMNYDIRICPRGIEVDRNPLVFYHFHRFRWINHFFADPTISYSKMPEHLLSRLYGGYLNALIETEKFVKTVAPSAQTGMIGLGRSKNGYYSPILLIKRLLSGEIAVRKGGHIS